MSLLGDQITLDEKTGKVKSCPGFGETEPDQRGFEEWTKQLLEKAAKGNTETEPQTAAAADGEDDKKDDEAEQVAEGNVSDVPKKSDELPVRTPSEDASDTSTLPSTIAVADKPTDGE